MSSVIGGVYGRIVVGHKIRWLNLTTEIKSGSYNDQDVGSCSSPDEWPVWCSIKDNCRLFMLVFDHNKDLIKFYLVVTYLIENYFQDFWTKACVICKHFLILR